MELKEINDLSIIKNLLENDISALEEGISIIKETNVPEIIKQQLEGKLIREKELLNQIDFEFSIKLQEKLTQKLSENK